MKLILSEVYESLKLEMPQTVEDVSITGVSTDTRSIKQGDLFIALKGDNFDAHDFLELAAQKGASAIVALSGAKVERGGTLNVPVLAVDDTLSAMQTLAAYYLAKLREARLGTVIAVTGSSGKTTTKDMLAQILRTKFEVYCTEKNFNNHIGLPKSIFELDERQELAVFELGMNHSGEIELLSNIVKPDYAVITNIGTAHIGHLGSKENIFKAKMEITAGLKDGGTLILNGDDNFLRSVESDRFNVVFAGSSSAVSGKGSVKASKVKQTETEISFNALTIDEQSVGSSNGTGEFGVKVPVLGTHNAVNAAIAMACALQLGVTIGEAATALSGYSASSMRSEVSVVKGVSILKDYYNANPESMQAALKTLSEFSGVGNRSVRKVAVLGDMNELGEHSASAHSGIVKRVNELLAHGAIDNAFFVGEQFDAQDNAQTAFADKAMLLEELKRFVKAKKLSAGDVVLIKGSRSMKMEYVFESLKSFINAELSDNVTLPRGAARLCVDITAIKENYNSICREIGGGVELMPMVKANAYGSGAEIVANVLSNCKHLAVADVKEAALLRRVMTGSAATDTSFVIIYQPPVSDVQVIAENNYIAAVSNLAFAEALNAAAARLGKVAEVHVEIDTGAGRLGVQPNDCKAFFTALNMLANISVDGIFMHYSCADGLDDEDIAFTERQTSLFLQAIADAESVVGNIKYKHACNGAAIFHPKAAHFNMVRPGYMLYGYYPNEELRQRLKLLPALTFSTVIVHIKDVEPGTPIGYGRSFVTNRPSKIATVAVGYSDGVSRRLSNRGYMAINGQKAPIVGKVCMDLTMIDVTDISGEVNIGDEVFVFDNVNITIDDIAELCGTIGYEIIAGIEDKADRVERF